MRRKSEMKKICINILLVMLIITIISSPVTAADSPTKVFVNGKLLLDMETEPFSDSGITFVPIRFISESLDFDVEYDYGSKLVSIIKGDNNIELIIGSNIARVDGKKVKLEVKPFIKEGRTFVPLRFIADGLGEEVVWDARNKIALVGNYVGEVKTEDSFLYTNEEYGYTLNFPNTWKKDAIIETKDGILYVYDKKSAGRFKQDGYESYGPVFEIRYSDYPVIATVPYDTNYILYYGNGKYIEAIFDLDFQYYPETKDSYKKIWDEGQKVLGSFKKLDNLVLIDKEKYKEEVNALFNILDNYVPNDIFNKDEIYTYRKPNQDSTLLYMRNMKNEEVLIKIESIFDSNGKLIQYHLKSYGYDLEENKLTQEEALKLANEFINKYVDENIGVIRTPDLYPSLYEENKHETYGDKELKYIIVVDLEHGFVEYFSKPRIN